MTLPKYKQTFHKIRNFSIQIIYAGRIFLINSMNCCDCTASLEHIALQNRFDFRKTSPIGKHTFYIFRNFSVLTNYSSWEVFFQESTLWVVVTGQFPYVCWFQWKPISTFLSLSSRQTSQKVEGEEFRTWKKGDRRLMISKKNLVMSWRKKNSPTFHIGFDVIIFLQKFLFLVRL